MSLTLEESCKKYEMYCRRHKDCPTFEEFNAKHYTNLPEDHETYQYFSKQVMIAQKNEGVPVIRRLPSLIKRFQNHLTPQTQAIPTPAVQIRPALKVVATLPPTSKSISMSIRPPAAPLLAPEAPPTLTLEEYKKNILASKSILLKEGGGLMVHLVPKTKSTDFEKHACKLTKNTWESLTGKKTDDLKMRDGSMLNMTTIKLDQSDLALFITNRAKKIDGPYFIRYSRI
jgi:hypothetical protein